MSTPPAASNRAAIAALRGTLRDAGYAAEPIQDALGTSGELVATSAELPVYVRRLGDDAFGALVRLFLLEVSVGRAEAERAVTAPLAEALLAERVLEPHGDEVRAAVRIVPHDDLLIASDRHDRAVGAEYVAGVHRPSATLANLTLRRPAARALDLCTGCGIQALLAARHAERVVATDVNERALAFAAFNAELNEVASLELRRGSFLEPVAGERFDLVVCNPPYVISPEAEVLFRDGGLPRDAVSELVVRGVPQLLEEGGFATIMASWIEEPDAAGRRPLSWVEGAGCDALLFHSGTEDPLTTAALWNRDAARESGRYAALLDRWVDYFREESIDAIAYGTLVLRRRADATTWSETLPLPRRPEPASAQLERILAGRDLLAALDGDAELLGRRVALAPSAALEQSFRPADGRVIPAEATVRLEDGLRYTAGLDPAAAALVLALDGERTLGEVAGDVGVDPEASAALARMLLSLGFAVATSGR